ncbi:hypothetical protein OAI04_01410 [Hyphomicrobiales bacterium]|nr:hypothetical protein [Hyphomicrobiales bacterium]
MTSSYKLAAYGNVEGRFRDNQELRYSLRALDKFFPDHGHVFIVTDQQKPAWLKNTEMVTFVDHRDLISPHHLPIFDSANIESYIHHIPDLSEHYFYFNDDVFFGKSVNIDDWFFDGGIYLSWSNEPEVIGTEMLKDSDSLENASRLSKKWLKNKKDQIDNKLLTPGIRRFNKNYTHTPRTFAHSPRPMIKSLMHDIEDDALELFTLIRSTTFRQWDKPTIISDFVLRYALAHNLAFIKDYSYNHIETASTNAKKQIDQLIDQFGSLDFFCLNDTTDNASSDNQSLADARNAMQKILPAPSSFEEKEAI